LALHNGTIVNYRDIAEKYLIKSKELGNILACLELGYLYGTMIGQEEAADTCFQEADNSKKFSFKNRITESMVSSRFTTKAPEPYEYLVEINKMKLAAGITYTCYNMERQALDWFQEISDNPLARIMILYYKMKDSKQRTPHAIKLLSDLMSPFEATPSLDYYGCMALSYGQLRLGQCYEHGHGVAIDDNKVLDYYSKACAYLKNNETYERLAEISNKNGSDIDLFPILCNAAHNDIDATFRLAQYYHDEDVNPVDPDVPNEKAARQYSIAAKAGHAESCYYYAKYKIHQKQQSVQLNVATNSKKAAGYLRIAANKNHGPSYYELGKLEIAAGLFEEGIDDLKQASFLHCAAASYELGELHRQGFTGVIVGHPNYRLPSNLKKALKYYHRAIELNHPLAMIQVGHFFETGALGQQSLSQAEAWYFKALHSGQCREGAAEYALGCLEETRLSISNAIQHRKFAYEWFEKSFNANNKQAKFKKGCYLLHGWATETDSVKKGIKILEDEYQDSNVQAIKELARYYQDQGNNKSAIFYWRKAKELHDPEAFEFLAQCFEKGLLGQDVNMEAAASLKKEAIDARKLHMPKK
jgi:TPR repeat protein